MLEDASKLVDDALINLLVNLKKEELTDAKYSPYIERLRSDAKLLKAFQNARIRKERVSESEKMDTAELKNGDESKLETHKTLKGALYLLDLSKIDHSYTFLAHSHDYSLCKRI
jgi:hypothetical protein